MKIASLPFLLSALLFLQLTAPAEGSGSGKSEFRVTKVELSADKPKGFGRFTPRGGNEYKDGEEWVYVYMEAAGCRPKRAGNDYQINLAVDVAIYYEDGLCIYDEKEANIFDYQTNARDTDGYLWIKIEAGNLKKGEYKVEMTVRDLNSKSESFALTRFVKI